MEGFDTYRLLADEIGDDSAQRVFEIFAGGTVNFPKKVTLFFRDLEIIKRFECGEGYEQLARSYRLSPQQIRNITSKTYRKRISSAQLELFDD